MTVFKGYETKRYQEHDTLIDKLVATFNANKATAIGATTDQAKAIGDVEADIVKAWMIQESGGGDAGSKAAWPVDPTQVNGPGDWSDYKKSLGLSKPTKVNTGDVEINLRAGIGWLARKGFGKSGQPPKDRIDAYFEGWSKALERYNGRSDTLADGRPYCEHYAERVLARAADPDTHFPIELTAKSGRSGAHASSFPSSAILELFQQSLPRFDEIEIDAAIVRDGDSYMLLLDPTNPAELLRVPTEFVRLGEELPPFPGQGTEPIDVRRVWVRRGAPTLRVMSSTFELVVGSLLSSTTATLRASLALKANGEGTLTYNGGTVPCLGRPGMTYEKDITIRGVVGTDKFERRWSTEFGVWMDWAVLIHGVRGLFIHQGPDNLLDNGGPSAGCIHLNDAKAFYDWVSSPTRLLTTFPW